MTTFETALTGEPERPRRLSDGRDLTEILGPQAGRYFGDGYRRVAYTLQPKDGEQATTPIGSWVGQAHYPAGWSRDAEGRERPQHLASADAIALAVAAWEREAAARGSGELAATCRLTSVSITAGTRPWLDLADIPVTVTGHMAWATGPAPSQFTATVGNMTLELGIDQLPSAATGRPGIAVGGPVAGTVYGQGFRRTHMQSQMMKLDADLGLADSIHWADTTAPHPAVGGLDSGAFPALCAIDHVATMGQVVQALALAMIRKERTGMGNMWMKSMALQMEPCPVQLPAYYGCMCQIVNGQARPRRSGTMIHDLNAELSTTEGASGRAVLAYETRAEP